MARILIVITLICASAGFAQQFHESSLHLTAQELSRNIKVQEQNEINRTTSERKSSGMAVIYSLLLPGMGELYAGNFSAGKYFTIAEATLWGVFAGMKYYSDWQEDVYKGYAVSHGSVSLDGKDEDYFANIGNYDNIQNYNNDKAFYRRFEEMYNVETHYWNWESTTERRTYRDHWKSSEEASNNLRFVVGAMILNRLVSAINAVRQVSAYNESLEETSTHIYFGYDREVQEIPRFTVNFSTAF
jgi:hypothetical protein